MNPAEYDRSGRIVAQAFFDELEKIGALPGAPRVPGRVAAALQAKLEKASLEAAQSATRSVPSFRGIGSRPVRALRGRGLRLR